MKQTEDFELPLFEHELQDSVASEPEPDLDNTSFFADKEYLEGQELTFSQKVERINALLLRNNLNRPVLYRILAQVNRESLPLSELEAIISTMPGFETSTQPPFSLVEWLKDVDALLLTDLDEKGNPLSEEDREGKTEDEIDDMVFDSLVEISEYGKATLASFDPTERLTDLLDEKPQRAATYLELLDFLREKRSYGDVDRLLRGNPILMDGIAPGNRPMQPSVFIDKLASAGVIVFEQGWVITPEGLSILDDQA